MADRFSSVIHRLVPFNINKGLKRLSSIICGFKVISPAAPAAAAKLVTGTRVNT
jgi:hypothetical protein